MNISFLIRIVIGLAFFQGVWSYIGLPPFHFRALLEICILILFLVFIHFLPSREDKSFRSPGLMFFLIFTFSVIISALNNNSDFYLSIKMYNRILFPYIFFISILNINLSDKSIKTINKFLFALVILQIPAAIYKYIKYGVVEGTIIGTFSTQAGALSTIFPLFIICYLIAFYYCYKKNPVYLLLIPCFIFFAWGGGKRAVFIFLPMILFLAYIIYNTSIRRYKISVIKMIPAFFLVVIIIGVTVYLGGRLNPIFNPERERWGTFDLPYMIDQTMNYQNLQMEGGTAGRFSTFELAFDEIIKKGKLERKVLGDGPDVFEETDGQRRYGIIYGVSGATYKLISTGLLGALSFLGLFITFGIKSYKYINYLNEPFYVAISFGTVLSVFLFCLDFLFYSVVFYTGYIPSLLFFYALALIFKQETSSAI